MKLATLSLLFAASLLAQIGGGSLTGTVTDPSGAAVTGARVTALNVATNQRSETRTNDLGYYEFPLLPAAEYRLEAEAAGFRRAATENFALNSGTRPKIDLQLALGDVTESVQVVAGAPLVNATTTDLGVVIDRARVESLPLNGRNFQQLVGLQAGVNPSPANGAGNRGGMEFHGSSGLGNNLLLDGVDMTFGEVNGSASDSAAGAGSAGSLINTVSIEAIEEFKTTANAASAEYGRAIGGVLNITTKSGTNAFHGTLFEFFRNDKLDANSFFSNRSGLAKPPLRWNQFGGNLGGPIVKNRVFFFFNYEGAIVRRASQLTGNVPTPALTAQLKPDLRSLFQNLFPTDYTATANPLVGLHRRNQSRANDEHTTLSRGDFDLGKHRLSTRFSYNHQDYSVPTLFPKLTQTYPTRFHNAVIQDNWNIAPSTFNELRIGFNRVDLFRFEDGRLAFPAWANTSGININASLASYIDFITTTYTLADNLSHIRGKHSLKAGFEIRVLRSVRFQDGQPTHLYNSVDDLIADRPNRIQLVFGGSRGLRTNNYGFYLQDDYRVTPRFQLNMGLRYDYTPPLRGGFNIATPDPFGPFNKSQEPMYAPDRNNFGPRLGMVWDPAGNQKLVVRAGAAMSFLPQQPIFMYDSAFVDPRLPLTAQLSPTDIPPAFTTYPFPQSFVDAVKNNPSLFPPSFNLPRQVSTFDREDAYAIQWNFSIQYALRQDTAVQASYVGNHNVNLAAPRTLNLIDPSTGRRPRPDIGDVNLYENIARSKYHALQLSANQRLMRGLMFDTYYTYSKILAYGAADSTQNFVDGTIQDPNNIAGSYGVKPGDIRHRFTTVYSYAIPTGSKAQSGIAKAVFSGWNLQGIIGWRSGLPINVLSGQDNYGNGRVGGQRPDYVAGADPYLKDDSLLNWLNRAAFDNVTPRAQRRFGNLGFNALRGASGFSYDAALHKTFPITERQRLTFRFEMFNALNHKVLGNPDTNLTGPNFGRILGASGGRNIQFGLKYFF